MAPLLCHLRLLAGQNSYALLRPLASSIQDKRRAYDVNELEYVSKS